MSNTVLGTFTSYVLPWQKARKQTNQPTNKKHQKNNDGKCFADGSYWSAVWPTGYSLCLLAFNYCMETAQIPVDFPNILLLY